MFVVVTVIAATPSLLSTSPTWQVKSLNITNQSYCSSANESMTLFYARLLDRRWTWFLRTALISAKHRLGWPLPLSMTDFTRLHRVDYYYRKEKCSSGPFKARKKRRKVAVEETRFHASFLCDLWLGAINRDNCGYYGWIVLKSDIERRIFITWTREVTRLVWLGGISINFPPSFHHHDDQLIVTAERGRDHGQDHRMNLIT